METRPAGETLGVLTAFRFDAQQSERAEDWESACEWLDDDQLLWLALRDPSDEEETAVVDALELGDELARRLRDSPERASVTDDGKHLYVTMVAAAGADDAPVLVSVECVVGENWVVTAHREEIAVLEEFLERAEGGGGIGTLDAPSFVAAVGEWVIASYLRAFEAVETELEELDARVMSETPSRDVSGDLSRSSSCDAGSGRCDVRLPRTARWLPPWRTPSSTCSPPSFPGSFLAISSVVSPRRSTPPVIRSSRPSAHSICSWRESGSGRTTS